MHEMHIHRKSFHVQFIKKKFRNKHKWHSFYPRIAIGYVVDFENS